MARLPQRIQLAHESLERIAPRDEFPHNSPHPLESSCPRTPFTATQALGVETSRPDPRMDPDKPANSRGVGG
jgi:hypothetical protein